MMPEPNDYTFVRYLAAKKSVDDRALNEHVWQALVKRWSTLNPPAAGWPQVLEIGAGTGTMVERLIERRLPANAAYHALDQQPENIEAARARFTAGPTDAHKTFSALTFEAADAFEFLRRPGSMARYDLIIAHAFLDLVDVPQILPLLRRALKPNGLLYATINFDGATIFEPVIEPTLDAQIERLYHAAMDARLINGAPSGDSRTGRHLIHHLQRADFAVLAAGASDWLVFGRDGAYVADEAYFLHFIVHTVYGALRDHPELNAAAFADWIAMRHHQVETGELVYLAHQIDVLASR